MLHCFAATIYIGTLNSQVHSILVANTTLALRRHIEMPAVLAGAGWIVSAGTLEYYLLQAAGETLASLKTRLFKCINPVLERSWQDICSDMLPYDLLSLLCRDILDHTSKSDRLPPYSLSTQYH